MILRFRSLHPVVRVLIVLEAAYIVFVSVGDYVKIARDDDFSGDEALLPRCRASSCAAA